MRNWIRVILFGIVVLSVSDGVAYADALSVHDDIACTACHRPEATVEEGSPLESGCQGCHVELGAGLGPEPVHADSDIPCAKCHLFHSPQSPTIGKVSSNSHELTGAPRARGLDACTACHHACDDPREILPGHLAAADWYHSNVKEVVAVSVSQSCLRCHDEDQDLPASIQGQFDPPQISVKHKHSSGVHLRERTRPTYTIHAPTDPSIALIDGRVECTTCHDLHNLSRSQLVTTHGSGNLCTECHEGSTDPRFRADPSLEMMAR